MNENWGFLLAGKLAEFIGGPMDGDRCELPGWALMHDGCVAVPDQSLGAGAVFNPDLNLTELKVAIYRPDLMEHKPVGVGVKFTEDGKALRYLYVPPEGS